MKWLLLIFFLLIIQNVLGGTVFLSPSANFKTRIVVFSFLPDLKKSMEVKECLILKNKIKVYSFQLNQPLNHITTPITTEKSFPFPKKLKEVGDLDNTSIKCSPGNYKISTWILEGLDE